MRTLVVYESMFGNTRRIAEAIAHGLAAAGPVTVVDAAEAPASVPDDVDLVVAGGPTHAFSMSRESTRSEAIVRGAPAKDVAVGLREWIEKLERGTHPQRFAAFDTRADVPLIPGAASKSAAKAAKKLGFHAVVSESFRVHGYEGPLLEGEVERAQRWGASLAETALSRT